VHLVRAQSWHHHLGLPPRVYKDEDVVRAYANDNENTNQVQEGEKGEVQDDHVEKVSDA